MIAALLDAAGKDPTVINGGIINAWGTNARLGGGDWMVAEADESDGTFVKLPATIAVVTNIDPEHLDHYGSFDALRDAFNGFVENVPFYGFVVLCIDHPEVQAMIARLSDRRLVTYGFSPQAEVRADNAVSDMDGVRFDAVIAGRDGKPRRTLKGLRLPMLGDHNVQNALAAVAIAAEMGIDDDILRRALAGFEGVKRRFTRIGEVDGVVVIDDYGHHPVEIAAVLKAARGAAEGQVVAVVQPHRYTRLRDLFEDFCTCFNDADAVIVADVYPAGEAPIEGIDQAALVDGLRLHGHRQVLPLERPEDLAGMVAGLDPPGRHGGLPGGRQHHRLGQRAAWGTGPPQGPGDGGRRMMATQARNDSLVHRLPRVRGRYTERAPLDRITWFKVGGPAGGHVPSGGRGRS